MTEKNISGAIQELAKVLAYTKKEAEIEDFLYSLLTKAEVEAIAARWTLVKEIAAGTPQRDIAKKYSLSLCKITRGSRELKKENSSFRLMISRLQKK